MSDLANASGILVALDPGSQQGLDLVKLLCILQMQAVVIVVVLRTRDQLIQGNLAVRGQGELLDKLNLIGSGH